MKFNTRIFWRMIAVFVVLDACVLMVGCGDWESQASTIIGLLGPALQALVAILAAFGVGVSAEVTRAFNAWAQQAQTALVNIKALIASYKTAAASAQPGILNEIQAGITALTANLGPIMASLHIDNPESEAKFTAGVAAVSAFVSSLLALLPQVTAIPNMSVKDEVALSGQVKETSKKFRSDFNTAVGFFGKQYQV